MSQIGILTVAVSHVDRARGVWHRLTKTQTYKVRATKPLLKDGPSKATLESAEQKWLPRGWHVGSHLSEVFKRTPKKYVPRTYKAVRREMIRLAKEKQHSEQTKMRAAA